jgi:hypothetical protein
VAFLSTAIAIFVIPALRQVFNVGLCCADDGYFAMIAKSLATRFQYGLPIASDTVSIFDGEIGTGPALVVPVALSTFVFGSHHWVPGSTALGILAAQIGTVTWVLASRLDRGRAYVFVGMALLALLGSTTLHYYYPYMLGEPTALGYLFLAASLLAFRGHRPRGLAAGGVCLSLAFLTKHLALFAVGGIVLIFLLERSRVNGWQALSSTVKLLVWAAVLPVIYELVKIATLGASGYRQHWAKLVATTTEIHTVYAAADDRIRDFAHTLAVSYGVEWRHVAALLVALGLVTFWRVRERDSAATTFGLMLFAGGFAHMTYFFTLCCSRPRYAWVGFGLLVLAVVSPVLLSSFRLAAAAAATVVLLAATPLDIYRSLMFQNLRGDLLPINAERQALLRLFEQFPKTPLVAQSWHSSFDVFYVLREPRTWWTTNDAADVPRLDAIVFYNDHFIGKDYPFYDAVTTQCRPLTPAATLYKAFRCGTD